MNKNLLNFFLPLRLVGKHDYRPYMVFTLTLAYLLFYVWEIFLTASGGQPIDFYLPHYALATCEIGQAPLSEIMIDSVRGIFMSTDFLLVLVNIMFLWVFGPLVEQFLGRMRFLSLYIVGGLAGYALNTMLMGDCGVLYGPGASVAAIIAAFIFLYPTKKVETLIAPLVFRRFEIPAFLIGFVYIGIQFVVEEGGPLSGTLAPVWDELGGFLFGFIFIFIVTMLFKPAPKADAFAHLDND